MEKIEPRSIEWEFDNCILKLINPNTSKPFIIEIIFKQKTALLTADGLQKMSHAFGCLSFNRNDVFYKEGIDSISKFQKLVNEVHASFSETDYSFGRWLYNYMNNKIVELES